jgi:outer membrane lipoprotein carrier protein
MKSLLILITLVWTSSYLLFAQHDPKAMEVMNSSKKKFNTFKDVTASFKYVLENKNLKSGNVTRSGSIKMKGAKYKIAFGEQDVICDGKTIWVIMKAEKEVSITDFDPEESLSIDRLYTLYEKETKAKFDKDEVIGSASYSKVSLFSINKNSDFARVEIWINKKSEIIERATIYQRNGSLVRYELNNLKTDIGVADTEFVFNKAGFPGYEIVDLR